ncbi:hypothetical protein B1748_15540 [Paenibacillus sp. MY03]|uniref:extracellular solute-binding protein n=1 Tax=Paenibacillus sp. MY03 TaxID=302980 RepID=UPI000B3D4423|nr:extracellular solute-binding protein [Paenibacillus sp. MY03]OUS75839.1 hypothetical protein B1748_15540 [Paenibacillus sp. MY03]
MRVRGLPRRIVMIAVIALCILLFIAWRALEGKPEVYPVLSEEEIQLKSKGAVQGDQGLVPYVQQLLSDTYKLQQPSNHASITVLATEFSSSSEEAKLSRRRDDEKLANVIDWRNGKGWIEWIVDVPQDGLFNLVIDYAPTDESFARIIRGIQIDGTYPFLEAKSIGLSRYWKDGQFPYERNSIGNEIRPVSEELMGWNAGKATDYSVSSEPLCFALTKGEHTIRMVGVAGTVSLYSLTLTTPEEIPSYESYISEGPPLTESDKWFQMFEAERFNRKSAVNVRTLSVSQSFTSPDPKGKLIYNGVGGETWKTAGDELEWEISVPESGHYAIDLKYFQGYVGDAVVYRTIMIDGKVPFQEMLHYPFRPNRAYEIKSLADENEEPYLFYLTEGKHRLSMIADNSPIYPVVAALGEINASLTAIERDIRLISGNYGFGADQNLDTARVWEVTRYDPEMESKLRSVQQDIGRVRDYLLGLNQAATDPSSALDAAVNRIEKLVEDVDNIPNQIAAFAEIKTSINTWITTIENQSLRLDYIVVRNPRTDPKLKVPNTWDNIKYTASNFMRTFVQQYDTNEVNDEDALTIWVMRGRDYVDLLEVMIEREFTPNTGIEVNVNLIPNQNVLMMSTAAGDQPDLALGIAMETPVEFAMRGAAEDLSKYPGFDDVNNRFNSGLMRSYQYDGGVYGLPETQMYNMLFYRTDIFEQLKLEPPNTWEDVEAILPTLQENGMNFMYPKITLMQDNVLTSKPDFVMPYYQQGTEFFTADGMQPQLTSEEGLAAFKQWTAWFSKYNLPKDVPVFFNHFRDGDIPVGVGDLTMYVQLMTAAPELTGRWGMLPLPGVRQDDGSVERWASQLTTSAFMMEASDKKEEAWKFLEWWTSDETQVQYGLDIESFAGIAYRWNTANSNALQNLLWTEEELNRLNEQNRWVKNLPYVPGYYFLARAMDFAWNDTIVSGDPPREALERAQLSLLREMERKQKEFGMLDDYDLHITPYDEPYRRE